MGRRHGNIGETVFKHYGPEDAGKKIGWSTVVPADTETEAYFLVGAYATVGNDGASVSIYEDSSGERLFGSSLVRGLSKACEYAVLLMPGEDIRIQNTDYIRVEETDASAIAGHSQNFGRFIDDEKVVWGTGEQELVDTLKGNLEQQGQLGQYNYAYLWINGAAGLQYPNDGLFRSPDRIAEVQLFDESMTGAARSEYSSAKEYELRLHDRLLETKVAYKELRRKAFSAGDYLKLRETVHEAHKSMEEFLEQLSVPKLVMYSPERHLNLAADELNQPEEGLISLYLSDMRSIQAGNGDSIADQLEREARQLDSHYKYTERGVVAIFALTTLGREYVTSKLQ